MSESDIKALNVEIKNIKEDIAEIKEEQKEDRKLLNKTITIMTESLTRLTTLMEKQDERMDNQDKKLDHFHSDFNEQISSLKKAVTKTSENNDVSWYQKFLDNNFGMTLKYLIIIILVLLGVKLTGVDLTSLFK